LPGIRPCSKRAQPLLWPGAASVQFLSSPPERLDRRRPGKSVSPTQGRPADDGAERQRRALSRQRRLGRRQGVRRSRRNPSGRLARNRLRTAPWYGVWSGETPDGGRPRPCNGHPVIEASERNHRAPQRCGRAKRFPLPARSRAADKKSASRRPRFQARLRPGGSGPILRASLIPKCPTGSRECQGQINRSSTR
jgi:hypothetical protein